MEHMGFLERHGDDQRTWYRSFTSAVTLEYSEGGEVEWDEEKEYMELRE